MDYGKILKFGFKVLAAAVAGAIVFIGVDKASSNNKKRQNNPPEDPCFTEDQTPERMNVPQVRKNNCEGDFVGKMRSVQDTCGKLFAFVQSLTTVADSFCRIFKTDNGYIGQPYYNNPWGYQQPIDMGNGVIWNRISPYIIETSTDPRYYNRL